MNVGSIILVIIIIILLYVALRYIFSDVNTLTGISSATVMQTIDAATLATSSANTSNFTYSVWFYIDDWNYQLGTEKIIYGRMGTLSTTPSDIKTMDPCPAVTLGAYENNLAVYLACYPSSADSTTTDPDDYVDPTTKAIIHTCHVANVPIQKWVNLLISAYGRTLDIYLDGKLIQTCLLPGVAEINADAPVYVTPNGGFSGFTAKFQYYPNSTDPQTAWNIYQAGYGASMLSNVFGKYQVKVSVMEGSTEDSSFTIG
jgi:hypothetical protein